MSGPLGGGGFLAQTVGRILLNIVVVQATVSASCRTATYTYVT